MKRLLDLTIILLLSPLIFLFIFIISLFVKIKLGSPILFKQSRPGLNGDIFNMVKFRTMTNERDLDGKLLSDNLRLTRFGKILRSTSLDELPEFWNVIKGDMSLVGPRPLLVEYIPLYDSKQNRRHEVLPGITGWAQVNGRNALSWKDRFEMDIWYVENHSLVLDLKIIYMTIMVVASRAGVTQEEDGTMKKFTRVDKK
jgi:sugar transferase EpsL